MGFIEEITYFNSFLLKKVIQGTGDGYPGEKVGAATWAALPWNPVGYPQFPLLASNSIASNNVSWYIEESRIRGGYNNKQVDFGSKAYLTESEDNELILSNGLIYSGIYNARSGINETNVFSTGENITKEVDPRYGGIQKLYSSDTDLIILQEDKVSRALIDKDAIYTADGNPALTATQLVLGQIVQYTGEYGISDNPESFAFKGSRMYFSDKNRGAIMRLSRDGLTEISSYGMRDYFRDTLANISESLKTNEIDLTLPVVLPSTPTNRLTLTSDPDYAITEMQYGMTMSGTGILPESLIVIDIDSSIDDEITITLSGNITSFTGSPTSATFYNNISDKIVGAYDNYNDKYVVSTQNWEQNSYEYDTLSFNESNNGWSSFWDYDPSFGGTLNSTFYTCKGPSLWKHYDEQVINNRGTFYGTYYPTSVQLSFNPMVSVSKNFQTINYEGTNGWQVDYFLSDPNGPLLLNASNSNYKDEASEIKSYNEGAYLEAGTTYRVGFNLKENKYVANLINKGVLVNDSTVPEGMPGQVLPGSSMSGIKGFYSTVKLSTDNTTDLGGAKNLFAVSSNYSKS
tara:strand:- start:9387 stop:11105 length:1719 start_codon:yes stop_codon:yes gene_type:complete